MPDYAGLMQILSTPRPNGSPAERQTLQALGCWLDRGGIPHKLHAFTLYPNFWPCIGLFVGAAVLLTLPVMMGVVIALIVGRSRRQKPAVQANFP